MARPGIRKHEVQKARLALIRSGRHPSIDAIRIELGNTGSKATISRYIKEIEADEGGAALPQASISTELQAIVATLAARLELEGQERLDLLRTGHAEEVRQLHEALDQVRGEVRVARMESERRQTELLQERTARQRVDAELEELRLEHRESLAQSSAQLAGMQDQLKSAEAHIASLEATHANAREALEHFRTASKEQRDREARQHEQQLQFLQKELASTADTLSTKQSELRAALQEKAEALAQLGTARAEKRLVEEQLRELKPSAERLASQAQAIEVMRGQAELANQQYETLRARASELEQRNLELERQLAACSASAQMQDQLLHEVLARIGQAEKQVGEKPMRSKRTELK